MSNTNVPRGKYPNIKGISVKKPYPTIGSQERGTTRRILREAWNGGNSAAAEYAIQGGAKCINQRSFRAVMNAGDLLSRKNYSCGGPDMIGSGNPGSNKMTTKMVVNLNVIVLMPKMVVLTELIFLHQHAMLNMYMTHLIILDS